jgi:uncharacterized YccA/Bax inhibitor family protein
MLLSRKDLVSFSIFPCWRRQQSLFHVVAHAFYRRSRELAITISLVMVFLSVISFLLDFTLEIGTGICN